MPINDCGPIGLSLQFLHVFITNHHSWPKLLVSFSELKGKSLLNIFVVATVIRHKFNTYHYWIEEMIFTLAGQSQRLSHLCTCKISGVFNGIQTHNLCDASAVFLPTVWSHWDGKRSICWAHVFLWKEWRVKEMFMNCGWEMKWSLYCLALKCDDHFFISFKTFLSLRKHSFFRWRGGLLTFCLPKKGGSA